MKCTRAQAKKLRHGLRYGLSISGIVRDLGFTKTQAEEVFRNYQEKYRDTFNFAQSLASKDYILTPILGRKVYFSQYNTRVGAKMSYTIQGSCVDLLLLVLNWILASKKVELRGHFHDSVYLACLCEEEHPNCKQGEEFKKELEEGLAFFTWKGTKIPVFKFGDVEWTTKGGA